MAYFNSQLFKCDCSFSPQFIVNLYLFVYFLQQEYQSALFFADKIASLSHGENTFIYTLLFQR